MSFARWGTGLHRVMRVGAHKLRYGLAGGESRVVELPPYRIHAFDFGASEQEIVLVHGLSGSARWWARNVSRFAEEFRVLIPDVIGFGQTPRPGRQPEIPEVAQILARWMTSAGLGRVHLVGHSMGGQICTHLAARFPECVDRLILVDPAGIPRPLSPGMLTRFALGLAPPRSWGDPLFIPAIVGDALNAGPRTILQAAIHIMRDDVRPLLPQVEAPTLIVWGERDRLVPREHAEAYRRGIPNARMVVLPAAAHNPMIDRPHAFNQLVLRFLDGEEVGE